MISSDPTPPAGPDARDHLAGLAELAAELVVDGRRAILGIAGGPGAGKTTFTEQLLAQLRCTHPDGWVAHLPMDGFHIADVQLVRLGSADRKGAQDTFDGLGYAHLLHRVRTEPDSTIYAPGFERTIEQPVAAALVIPPQARLVVTEGNYLLLDQEPWRTARAELEQTWYITTDHTLRLQRLVARHVRFGKTPTDAHTWVMRSDEANAQLVATSSSSADHVILNTKHGWRSAQLS